VFFSNQNMMACVNGGNGFFLVEASNKTNLKIIFSFKLESFMTGIAKEVIIKGKAFMKIINQLYARSKIYDFLFFYLLTFSLSFFLFNKKDDHWLVGAIRGYGIVVLEIV